MPIFWIYFCPVNDTWTSKYLNSQLSRSLYVEANVYQVIPICIVALVGKVHLSHMYYVYIDSKNLIDVIRIFVWLLFVEMAYQIDFIGIYRQQYALNSILSLLNVLLAYRKSTLKWLTTLWYIILLVWICEVQELILQNQYEFVYIEELDWSTI